MSIGNLKNEADLKRFVERVTSNPVPSALVAGGPPTGAAGGDLGGTYPNPTVPGLAGKANTVHTHAQSDVTNLVTDLAGKQPLDSDLTAIAALSTTTFGRSLLALVDAAAARSTIGAAATSHTHAQADITNLVTDLSNKQPLDSDLTAIAALATTAYGRSLLTLADAAAARSSIGAAATSHTHAQADVTNLVSDLAAKAPLASPTFTGNVVVPTADAATEAVNLAQMQEADLAVQSGYTRMEDVKYIGYATWVAGPGWQTGLRGSRSGNVITATANGVLTFTEIAPTSATASMPEVTPTVGDRILLVNQAGYIGVGDAADNGIYEVTNAGSAGTPWVLTRTSDANTTGELIQFSLVKSTNRGFMYYLSTAGTITINTTDQTWTQYVFFPSGHKWTHAPGESDALATAAAGSIQPDDAAAEGTAVSYARSDHKHSIVAATASTISGTNAEGSATSFARSDHNHALPNAGTNFRTQAAMDFASNAHTANLAYYGLIVVPSAATLTGIAYRVGATSNGNVTASLYNSSGTRVANRATPVAQASANFGQAVGFDSTYAAAPGVYVACLTFSSATGTSRKAFTFGAGTVAGPGSGNSPTSLTPPAANALVEIPIMSTY